MSISKKDYANNNSLILPAHNNVPYVLDSDNKTQKRFSYILDILVDYWDPDSMSIVSFNGRNRLQISDSSTDHPYKIGDRIYLAGGPSEGEAEILDSPDSGTIITSTLLDSASGSAPTVYKLFRNEIRPRPTDGLGVADVSDITQNVVNTPFDPTRTGVTFNTEIVEAVKARYHELYNTDWSFDGFFSAGTRAAITGSTTPPFDQGDQIYVQQDIGTLGIEVIAGTNNEIKLNGDRTADFSLGDTITISGSPVSSNNLSADIIQEPEYTSFNDRTTLVVGADLSTELSTPAVTTIPNVPVYEGNAIVQTVNSYDIVLKNKPYQTSSFSPLPIKGTVNLSNDTRKINLDEASSDVYEVWDAALLKNDNRATDDFAPKYIMQTGNTGEFLTTFDESFISLSGAAHLEFVTGLGVLSNDEVDKVGIKTNNQNSTDGVYWLPLGPSTGRTDDAIQNWYSINCGPEQLNKLTAGDFDLIASGTLPVIKSDTLSYKILTTDDNFTAANTTDKKFKIYENQRKVDSSLECRPYEIKRLVYKDRLGSYDGMIFHLLKEGTITYRRTEFRKGGLDVKDDLTFDSRSFQRGKETLYVDQQKELRMTTGFISESEFERVKELLDSTSVYLEFDEYGERVPVNIRTDEVEMVNDDRRQLQEVVIALGLSNKEPRQRN